MSARMFRADDPKLALVDVEACLLEILGAVEAFVGVPRGEPTDGGI